LVGERAGLVGGKLERYDRLTVAGNLDGFSLLRPEATIIPSGVLCANNSQHPAPPIVDVKIDDILTTHYRSRQDLLWLVYNQRRHGGLELEIFVDGSKREHTKGCEA
jgi:hypothetical protein